MQSVNDLWQRFSAHAQAQSTQHPIDRRAFPAYAVLIPWFVILFANLAIGNVELSKSEEYFGLATALTLLLVGLVARRYQLDKSSIFLETTSITIVCGWLSVASTAALSIVSAQFIDDYLHSMDKHIGFNWIEFFNYYQNNPYIYDVSIWAYGSLHLQMIFLPILLVFLKNERILWIYANSIVLSLFITVLSFRFTPAYGPFLLHGIEKEDLHGRVADVNWIVGALIDDLRSGRTRDIGTAMTGLVSMPSFHAAAAVILGWVSLYLGWLRIPLVLLNVAMLLSTIISGSHYLVDLIAGAALAVMAIWAATRLVDWQHSLQQPRPLPAE